MHLEAQIVRMAMYSYNLGTLPLGATHQEAGLLFQTWRLEANSWNPFLGAAGAYWKEVGMTGTEDLFADCGWKEEFIGCFQTSGAHQPCIDDEVLRNDFKIDGLRSEWKKQLRNYMIV